MDETTENGQTEKTQRGSLSNSLAAENTYLAWIRTGIALLGLGFVVARFGLFLERLDYMQHVTPAHSYGLSVWFGTGLILAGVGVYLSSAWNYVRLIRALNRGVVVLARAVSAGGAGGGAGSGVFGVGGAGDGNLFDFGAGVAIATTFRAILCGLV